MIFNMVGGGGSGLKNTDAVLIVTVPTGSTVTATKNGVTLTPTIWVQSSDNTLDTAIFSIKANTFDANAWTVTATLGADTASDTVVINEAKEYEVYLIYAYHIFKSGDGAIVPFTTNKQQNGTISVGTENIKVGYSSTYNGQVVCYNTTKLNISDYSTLHVVATFTAGYSEANYTACIFVASSTPDCSGTNYQSKYVATELLPVDGAEHNNAIDLTNLSSSVLASAYVGYKGIGRGTITEIYFS